MAWMKFQSVEKLHIAELRDRKVRSYIVVPEDFGLRRAPLEAIRGGDAQHNAGIIHKVLGAHRSPMSTARIATSYWQMQPERWSQQAAPRIFSMACASPPNPLIPARPALSSKRSWRFHNPPQATTANPHPDQNR